MHCFIRKAITVFILLALLALSFAVYAESYSWDCPNCGRTGNTGNFCGGCGQPAPWMNSSTEPVQENATTPTPTPTPTPAPTDPPTPEPAEQAVSARVREETAASNGIVYTMYGYIEKSGQVISQQDINEYKKFGLSLDSAAQPSDGKVYLYVFFGMKNNSAAPYRLNLMLDHDYASADGVNMYYSFNASMAGAFVIDNQFQIGSVDTTEVEPGKSAIVYFPYEAPSGWQEAVIRLKLDKTYEFVLGKADVLTEDQAKALQSGSAADASATDPAVSEDNAGDDSSNADAQTKESGVVQTSLSPDNKCPAQPQIYCSPRCKNLDNNSAFDTNNLSAKQINNNSANRSYGLYFKFTPSVKDNGYQINRIDVVVSDAKTNTILYVDGFDTSMRCQRGYYWAWDFFSLEGLYDNMREMNGQVVAGQYRMDIYFNQLWAGKTSFRIQN